MSVLGAVPCGAMQWGGAGLGWLWRQAGKKAAVAAVVLVVAVKVRSYVRRQQRRKRWAEAGKDVVVLHIFERARTCPSLSPFVLKLETYLRMTNIQYKVDHEVPMSYKGKCPWITLNGEDLADSQLIMEHLAVKYNKNLSTHLSEAEKGVARAFLGMVENHLLGCYAYWRYAVDRGAAFHKVARVPVTYWLFLRMFVRDIQKRLWMLGVGRHTPTEVKQLERQDMAALSAYLGQKPFLMGEKPTEIDCAVFGTLCQMAYCSPGSHYPDLLQRDFPNLDAYIIRVRDRFWPDWDACLAK